ncbi:MAG: malate dehydrogenase [Acidobacteriota bacterium]|jgi:malate dehydrogenase
MKKRKVTVIGAGNVGATAAQRIAEGGLADVVVIDIADGIAKGKGLDLWEAAPVSKHDCRVMGTGDYADTKDSDIVVMTAGIARKPGMSRDDLVQTNFKVVKSCTESWLKYSPNAMLIMVTNPLDVMAYTAWKVSGLPKHRVVGMAGILDTARFRSFLALELDVSVENITAFVLGGHGDDMVPLVRYTNVAGIPVTELIPKDRLDAIVERTRKGGGEIVKHLQTGSAFYAPSAAVTEMVEAILLDRKKILPCSAYLDGEYGQHDVFAGVPVKLGANGLEKIMEIKLSPEEQEAFGVSAGHVKETIGTLPL